MNHSWLTNYNPHRIYRLIDRQSCGMTNPTERERGRKRAAERKKAPRLP